MQRTDLIAYHMGGQQPLAAVPEALAPPGLSLVQLLHILRAHWRRALLASLAVFLLGALVVMLLPRTYTATATLMINYQVNDPLGGKDFPEGLLASYVSTQAELLRGPQVLIPVIDQLHLENNRHYSSGYHGSPEGLHEWIEQKLAQKLVVTQGQTGSQLIYVSFSASDAAEAARIANAVVDTYMEQAGERASGPASEHARRYSAQLEELKAKVNKAQDEVTAFRQKNNMIDIGKPDDEIALLASMEAKLADAQAARHAAEARLAGNAAVSAGVLGSTMVQTLKTQLAVQEAHMAELRATLGPRHPDVLQLQSQIDATRASLGSELHSWSDGEVSDLKVAQELEQKLSAAVDQQRAKVLRMKRFQDEAANLQLELESAEAVYKRALEGYDQVLAASSGRYTNTTVIDRARTPVKPTTPKVMKSLAACAVLGLLLGFGGALLYELVYRRVRCRDDIERSYGVPVLAEIMPLPSIGSAT
ncbi:MAG TPA: Wzz/FepE/Etk N-terminal domain-containing protein [Nevskia sp.]|nr:Wzz/FepE/Etk N-terminal domain-containing protein [Nevskia sp.]